jgi:hypothetical protein
MRLPLKTVISLGTTVLAQETLEVLGVRSVGRTPKAHFIVKVTFQLNDGAGAV